MERDEDTGLSHHGARLYAMWLGRWTSPDPADMTDGVNLYRYVAANPVAFIDSTGTEKRAPSIAQMERRLARINAEIAETSAVLSRYDEAEAKARANLSAVTAARDKARASLAGARVKLAIKSQSADAATARYHEAAAKAEKSAARARFGQRILGGLKMVQAGGEFVVAAGLAAVGAEPLAVAVGLHASDVAVTGLTQLWTAKETRTQTSRAVSAGARKLGASDEVAYWVGEGADFMASIGIAVKAPPAGAFRSPSPDVTPPPAAVSAAPAFASATTDADFIKFAARITPKPGVFDVVVHADAQSFWVRTIKGAEEWSRQPVRRVVDFMRRNGYTGGPVRLIACNSGVCAAGPAQQLANELGAAVKAPIDKAWIHYPSGRVTVGPAPTSPPFSGGGWVWFAPTKR